MNKKRRFELIYVNIRYVMFECRILFDSSVLSVTVQGPEDMRVNAVQGSKFAECQEGLSQCYEFRIVSHVRIVQGPSVALVD